MAGREAARRFALGEPSAISEVLTDAYRPGIPHRNPYRHLISWKSILSSSRRKPGPSFWFDETSLHVYPRQYMERHLVAGATSDLVKRAWEQEHDVANGFMGKYRAHDHVWFEQHATMVLAITRGKVIKGNRPGRFSRSGEAIRNGSTCIRISSAIERRAGSRLFAGMTSKNCGHEHSCKIPSLPHPR